MSDLEKLEYIHLTLTSEGTQQQQMVGQAIKYVEQLINTYETIPDLIVALKDAIDYAVGESTPVDLVETAYQASYAIEKATGSGYPAPRGEDRDIRDRPGRITYTPPDTTKRLEINAKYSRTLQSLSDEQIKYLIDFPYLSLEGGRVMSEAEIVGYLTDNHDLSEEHAQKLAHVIFRKLDFSSIWEQIETLFHLEKTEAGL